VAVAGARSLLSAFTLGLVTGIVYFTGTLYWITYVMAAYGDMATIVAVLINALLIAFQALFVGIFAMIVRRLVAQSGPTALMAAPLVWVTIELGRTYVFTGFPWVLLGYSQVTVLPIAQLASVLGVYGLSALVAGVNAAFAVLAVHRAPTRMRLAPLATMAAVLVAVAIWGGLRLSRNELTATGEPMRVGIVQGNVDQSQKRDSRFAAAIFGNYLRMTREAIDQGAAAVFWPESSAPFMFSEDQVAAAQLRGLAMENRVSLIFGSDEIERSQNARDIPDKYYNSAYLVRPDGTTGGVYRKIHLVPFGEYVPLRRMLFFVSPLVETIGDFSAGTEAVLLPLDGHPISIAICYEVVYPNLVRQFVRGGSELLTTITNDAWFGRTSAPYQHFAQAAMRAIEGGRYLVRAANTGVSGIVDPYGRVLAQTRIYEPAVTVGEIRFLTATTVYSRIGDVFAYASAVMTVVLLVATRRRSQQS
jgi:apolipoprotein N-acyltransferase